MSKLSSLWSRILEISYKNRLSHIGSCLSSVNIIKDIYNIKQEKEPFILSCGHAGLALYCVLEEKYGINAEELFLKHGIHPNRDLKNHIYCSTGSLGQGITIATGMALQNKNDNVYCLISDGEFYEGSVFESLNFARENNLTNLKLYCNYNGYSALSKTNSNQLAFITKKLLPWAEIYLEEQSLFNNLPFLKDIDSHYYILNNDDWVYLNENNLIHA